MSEYQVGEVARMAGVSIRTLHHYDEIGLLRPSGRSDSRYRRYAAHDIERLRRILFYRELDFGLGEIAEILAQPQAAAGDQLRRQHRLLRERRARTDDLLTAIETEMEARRMGISLTEQEQLEVFGTDKLTEWDQEASSRWGDTDAYRQSARRAAAYTKADWVEIKRQADANVADFVQALEAGAPAGGERAMDLAEAHRRHISRWFYDCSPAMHRALAEMYIADPRFARSYEDHATGLAGYVHDAIVANAARLAARGGADQS